jgi:predicted phosphodiesterase
MKIRPFSDLHLEFASIDLAPIGEDLIIFAGDIGIHTTGLEVAKKVARNFSVPVLYIAGNHEYYRNSEIGLDSHTWEGTPDDLRAAADLTDKIRKGRATYFENTCIVYKGVRFIGSTLWTGMDFFGENDFWVRQRVVAALNDYQVIWSEMNHPLQIEQVIQRYKDSLFYLSEKLHEPFKGPTVVLTHHTPSSLSVSPRYRDDPVTAAYSNRLENLILDTNPAVWFHGHTHCTFDYDLGATRIVCNPRGYQGYEDTGYNPELLVEV